MPPTSVVRLPRRLTIARTAACRCLIRRRRHRRHLLAQRALTPSTTLVQVTDQRLLGLGNRLARIPQDRWRGDYRARLIELSGSRACVGLPWRVTWREEVVLRRRVILSRCICRRPRASLRGGASA